MALVQVDYDPFVSSSSPVAGKNLIPVDHDPFTVPPAPAPAGNLTPVDYDPFGGSGNLIPVSHDPFAAAAPGTSLKGEPQIAGVTQTPQSVTTGPEPETMEARRIREERARASAAPTLTSPEEKANRMVTPAQEEEARIQEVAQAKLNPWLVNAPLEAGRRILQKVSPEAGITKTANSLMERQQNAAAVLTLPFATSPAGKVLNAVVQHVAPESEFARKSQATQEAYRRGLLSERNIPLLSDMLGIAAYGPAFNTRIGAFILPVMEGVKQVADAAAGMEDAINPKALANATIMAGILKGGFPRDAAEKLLLSGGGLAERVGKALIPTAVKAGEMAAVQPVIDGTHALIEGNTDEFKRVWKQAPEDFARTLATFAVIDVLPLAKAGLAGEIEGKFRGYGMEANEARKWANTITYNPEKIDVLSADIGKKWATALNDEQMATLAKRIIEKGTKAEGTEAQRRGAEYGQESQGRVEGIQRGGQPGFAQGATPGAGAEPGGTVPVEGAGGGETSAGGILQASPATPGKPGGTRGPEIAQVEGGPSFAPGATEGRGPEVGERIPEISSQRSAVSKARRVPVSFEIDPIKAFVLERGGVRPGRDDEGNIVGAEEFKIVPRKYRGKVSLDEMAADIKEAGMAGEDFDGEQLRLHLAQEDRPQMNDEGYAIQEAEAQIAANLEAIGTTPATPETAEYAHKANALLEAVKAGRIDEQKAAKRWAAFVQGKEIQDGKLLDYSTALKGLAEVLPTHEDTIAPGAGNAKAAQRAPIVPLSKASYEFAANPAGNPTWGTIDNAIVTSARRPLTAAPIMLQNGWHSSMGEGFGIAHIRDHEADMRKMGYPSAEAFLSDVLQNFNRIYQQPNGRLLLAKQNGKQLVAVVELRNDPTGFYGVTTAYPERVNKKFKAELIWERSEPVQQPPETASPPSSIAAQGSGAGPMALGPNYPSSEGSIKQGGGNVNKEFENDVAPTGTGWPGGELGKPKERGQKSEVRGQTEDDREFSALPLELPEMVQFSRAMLGGKYPEVRQRLGKALGRFSHAGTEGDIKLLASIFKLITPQEEERMRAEADAWAAKHAEPNDNVPALAEERFKMLYDQAYEQAKTKNPVLASKVLAHEIGHVVSWFPENIVRGRGNILGQIASFVDYTKSLLAKLPGEGSVLTEADRRLLRQEAQKRGGKDKDAVSRIYSQMVGAEIKRRNLVTKDEIVAELKPLIAWWCGQETMEEYFEQPHEMYAEALSVLLNNPAAVAKHAPKFYELFNNWFENKPEVKRLYDAVQDSINSGTIYKARVETMYRDMAAADESAAEWAIARNERSRREIKDGLFYTFDRRFGPIQRRIATIKQDELRQRALGALSDSLYRGALGELIMDRVQNDVVPLLTNNNFQWVNLGEYLFHQRILYGDRADIGNPWGMTPKASAERLTEMRRDYGPERYAALEEASLWLRSIYEQEALSPAKEFGIYDENMMQILEDNVFYATFSVFKDAARPGQDSLQNALEQKFGNMVTSHMFKQYGTLKPVKNPATATVQKMLAIGTMIYRERAKYEATNALLSSEYADEWRPAEMQWTGKRREIKIIENERIGTLIYMHAGKLHGYYGPRALVDAFSFRSPIETMMVARVMSTASSYLKGIFTSANPAFWPVAFVRDVRGFNRLMPGTSKQLRNWIPFSGGTFGQYAWPALKASFSTFQGRPNLAGQEALRRGIVISRAAGYRGEAEDNEYDREIKRRGLPVMIKEDLPFVDRALNFLHHLMETGQIFERTVKIAGMLYLDDKFPAMPEPIKRITIRRWSGSPDFLEKGAGNWMADLFALFYNPIKEGLRSEKTAWAGWGGEKGRAGEMFWNTLRWTILPRLGLVTLLGGGLALLIGRKKSDRSEWEQMYQDGPSERDRRTYHCIPLRWIDKKERKALYLRWPLEQQEQIASAVTDTALQAAITGSPGDVLPALTDYAGNQLPGMNPLLKLAKDWLIYAGGGNPYDNFRNRNVLSDDEQVIRGLTGLKAMERYTWNSTLGSALGQIPQPERPDDVVLTAPEKILRAPVISQLVGRWFKISNAGYRERLEKSSKPVAEREAEVRLETDAAAVQFKKTGQIDSDIAARLAQGKYLYDKFKEAPLPPELGLKRYYYTHFMAVVKKAAIAQNAPVEVRTILRQPTQAQKLSVAQEVMEERR